MSESVLRSIFARGPIAMKQEDGYEVMYSIHDRERIEPVITYQDHKRLSMRQILRGIEAQMGSWNESYGPEVTAMFHNMFIDPSAMSMYTVRAFEVGMLVGTYFERLRKNKDLDVTLLKNKMSPDDMDKALNPKGESSGG